MELLERLTGCVGCAFLSDLPFSTVTSQSAARVSEISDEAYPLEEWNRAVDYVAGPQAAPAATVVQAKERLLAFWSTPRGARGRKRP